MKKIALVVHRYGKEIGSGAEYFAMQLAEHLKNRYELHILTTTCLAYETWDNYFPAGETDLDGVKVIRFATEHGRIAKEFSRLSHTQHEKVQSCEPTSEIDDNKWIDLQGPFCPGLVGYIETNRSVYDAFLFITYIYYPTVRGMPLVAGKSLFFPTAHDEPWIRQTIFQTIFSLPRYLCFLTEEEDSFVRVTFNNDYIPGEVIGSGINFIGEDSDPENFRKKFKIRGNYIVYIGRIDAAKNCDQMIHYFLEYKKHYPSDLKLVLIGSGSLDVQKHDDIILTGFVAEKDKHNGIAGALVAISPSRVESLCIALLECFAERIPALVNGECAVLRGHCLKSNAGLYYNNQREFEYSLKYLLTHADERKIMGEDAFRYVKKNYTWGKVVEKLSSAIEYVTQAIPLAKPVENLIIQGPTDNAAVDIEKFAIKQRDIYTDGQCKATVITATDYTEIEPAFPPHSVTVLFVSSDYFTDYLGVLIHSIIMNANPNRSYDLVILKTDMSVKNMNLIIGLANGKANIAIRFVDVNKLILDLAFKVTGDNYNNYTFYRLLLPSLMRQYEKVLYLDSDVLVNADLAELFDTEITEYCLAATYDVTVASWQAYDNDMRRYFTKIGLIESGKYFQAGVILFNIAKMNEKFERKFLITKACEEHYILNDQDLLNIYCKGQIKYVGQEWNVFALREEAAMECNRHLPEPLYREIVVARKEPKIIHYTEKQFPCLVPNADMDDIYWHYAHGTPFYERLLIKMLTQNNPKK